MIHNNFSDALKAVQKIGPIGKRIYTIRDHNGIDWFVIARTETDAIGELYRGKFNVMRIHKGDVFERHIPEGIKKRLQSLSKDELEKLLK